MFEHFDNPEDLFAYRLGMAMTMEHDSLEMLGTLRDAARDTKVKQLFEHHANETREQIQNLEKVFTIMGIETDKESNPTTKGLSKEGESLLRKSHESLHDDVAVSAALGTEHFEISAYQTLIATADAMGAKDAVALLEQNCEQEMHASKALQDTARELAHASAGSAGGGAGAGSVDAGRPI